MECVRPVPLQQEAIDLLHLIKANPLTIKHVSLLDGHESTKCLPTHQTILYRFERGKAIDSIYISITQTFYCCI